MKALLLVASLFVSAAAFAGEYTAYQGIIFQEASATIPANKVCIKGDVLLHKTKEFAKIVNCEESGNNCSIYYRRLEQPVSSTAQRCKAGVSGSDSKYGCKGADLESYALVQGPVVKTYKYRSYNDLLDRKNPRSTGTYTIESCR